MKPINTDSSAARERRKTDDELPPPPPPPVSEQQSNISSTKVTSQGTHAWYTLEHTLLFISLVVLAVSISLILNYFVDKYYPSMAATRYDYRYLSDSPLRGYLAALIVSMPLFSYLFMDITRRTKTYPELRSLMARKSHMPDTYRHLRNDTQLRHRCSI